jgi:copper chaperone
MRFIWQVDNIKCGGCAGRIRQQLSKLAGVSLVEVDVGLAQVRVEADEASENLILAELARLGYPLSGTSQGLSAIQADVRSFVSCAIGRMQSETAS